MNDPRDSESEIPGPPEFPEIEQQLIGTVLVRESLFEAVADLVESKHFVEEAYGRIWSVLQEMYRRGLPMSGAAVVEPIVDELGWPKADTMRILTGLMKGVASPSVPQARYLAGMVKDIWTRRQVWQLGHDMIARTRGGLDNSGAKIIEETEAKLFEVGQDRSASDSSLSLSDAIAAGLDQANAAAQQHADGKLIGVPSGLAVVDRKLGGFRSPDFIVIGARTSMGKTSFALRLAKAAAEYFVAENPEKPRWVIFFSMEMGADQLALRLAAAEARISFERIRLGHCDTAELMALEQAGRALRDLPILIDDTSRLSVPAMRIRARRLKRKKGLGLFILDYLQLAGLSSDEMKEARGNRVQEVSTITRGLKALAKDLDVPTVALSQLSREIEKREDKRPQLSDLRESGTIEQDADLVMFLFREGHYLAQRRPIRRDRESDLDHGQRVIEWQVSVDALKHVVELIIAKNRHGSLGTLMLKFLAEIMLFEDDTPGGAGTDGRGERAEQLQMEIDNRIV